ncbi:MAG: asparagine synthase (glutamine-hydrolyzing) [Proteobacteria bacterium]|nr:MAG: asparagine synthase (glutamine-hydrolyzing) [Pseudomonadota bacterium]
MCGIIGLICAKESALDLGKIVEKLASCLAHRGPDEKNTWIDRDTGIAFGHRRLSIVELSSLGSQPMISASGRFVITYNGEIYNFQALRKELEGLGSKFRGGSDTEVMLAAFEEWGIEQGCKKFVGMFAFGVWDQRERVLTLARDRLGEKPLYYGWNRGFFGFASELSAIGQAPGFEGRVETEALDSLLRHGYIFDPLSIYQGIYKLPPGCMVQLKLEELNSKPGDFNPQVNSLKGPRAYWSALESAERGLKEPFAGNFAEGCLKLEELLKEAIKGQMIADVPLGAFLSGGIDSSLVVALMQAQSARPVKTFSIGFEEKEYNEANHAKLVAKHLGTDHTEMYVTSKDALDVVPLLSTIYTEPFADSSQIPTYLVSKIARRSVTVSLSGDGGDEIFGGYLRYPMAESLHRKISYLPGFFRAGLAGLIKSFPPVVWDRLLGMLKPLAPKALNFHNPGQKLLNLARVLGVPDALEMYQRLLPFVDREKIVLNGSTDIQPWFTAPGGMDALSSMMLCDLLHYMPFDILVKVDRAAMAVSLESRAPLLDHRVVEFALSLPTGFKIEKNTTKRILREVLYRYVPRKLVDRPKMGFGIPFNEWLRGPLREWAEDLLDERSLRQQGYLDAGIVRERWRQHLSGRYSWGGLLWNILMFQGWLKSNRSLFARDEQLGAAAS